MPSYRGQPLLINIDDSAKTSNATTATRTSANSAGVTNFFGLETLMAKVLPKGFDPAQAINTNSSLVAGGTGGGDDEGLGVVAHERGAERVVAAAHVELARSGAREVARVAGSELPTGRDRGVGRVLHGEVVRLGTFGGRRRTDDGWRDICRLGQGRGGVSDRRCAESKTGAGAD